MLFALFTAAVGVLMFALGRWGRREVAGLIPPSLPAVEREKRERVYKRGAIVLQIVGVLFLVVVAVGCGDALLHH